MNYLMQIYSNYINALKTFRAKFLTSLPDNNISFCAKEKYSKIVVIESSRNLRIDNFFFFNLDHLPTKTFN